MCNGLLAASHKLKSERGLGLIELVIALALLSLVLALGYSFFFFGTGAFDRGESQQNVQQNARQAASFITEELRFATAVEILDAVPDPNGVDDGWHYIYVKSGDPDYIYILNDTGEKPIAGIIADGTTYGPTSLSFQGAGSKVLDFSIAALKNSQNFSIDTSVQPLNLSVSIGGFNDGPVVRYRKALVADSGGNGGDPLPDGYFAFVDLNHDRVYTEGIDIPVPLAHLLVAFNTATYNSGYEKQDGTNFGAGDGLGGSLVILPQTEEPFDIIFSAGLINWEACHDIVIMVNIEKSNWTVLKIIAVNDIEIGQGVTIHNKANGEGIILQSNKVTIENNASLIANGSSGIGITAVNDISAVGTEMTTTSGGANLNIKSNNGTIDVRNIRLTNAAGDITRPGEVGIVLDAANGINAEGAVMNNTNGGGTIKLESKPAGTININGARLNDNEVTSGGVVIEGNGDLYAANTIIDSKASNNTIITIGGNIDLANAELDTGVSGEIAINGGGHLNAVGAKITARAGKGTTIIVSGNIDITGAEIPIRGYNVPGNTTIASGASIIANESYILARHQNDPTLLEITAINNIEVRNAELSAPDIIFTTNGNLSVQSLELTYLATAIDAIAKKNDNNYIPAEQITGCIAKGTINGENYCSPEPGFTLTVNGNHLAVNNLPASVTAYLYKDPNIAENEHIATQSTNHNQNSVTFNNAAKDNKGKTLHVRYKANDVFSAFRSIDIPK